MSASQITYQEARKLMKPGDVLAFGGKGHCSELIKLATFSTVSHVGIVLQTQVLDDQTSRFFNQVIEATSDGVGISRLSDMLSHYDGEVWWLPLKKDIRNQSFDTKAFFDFLFLQNRKPYDMPQAVKSAVDLLDDLPFDIRGPSNNKEDFSKFFCSELVAAGLEKAGVTGNINASEVTPIDLCRWNIYEENYYQIKGDMSKKISRFNTASPEDWGH